jgi:peptidyl-prolyl cis-trans isomerase B (cyclophilin B)
MTGAACRVPGPRCLLVIVLGVISTFASTAVPAQQKSPGAGAVVVLETSKGVIEFETYPDEAPRTVARILELVKKGFYNGLRFHRAEPNFLIQVGDPASRNVAMQEWWGRGGSGKPIGVSEITKKRRHIRGAVAMAYPGTDPRNADCQFYIVLKARPELDAKYTVFGKVITGLDVIDQIRRSDVLKKATIRE